ncbi:DUF6134 family protein [Pseudomonadota bacterium]
MKHILLLALGLIGLSSAQAIEVSSSDLQKWNFKVFLDDKEIGFHKFEVKNERDKQKISTNASFNVKFFIFSAYKYEHDNLERWRGRCLTQIDSVTNDNGKALKVVGRQTEDGFYVETHEMKKLYGPCVKTFAYWDYSILQEKQLLNSQTGELVDVDIEFIGRNPLTINGKTIRVRNYRLIAKNLQIDLWYSDTNRWLALESLTESGRIVRYQSE